MITERPQYDGPAYDRPLAINCMKTRVGDLAEIAWLGDSKIAPPERREKARVAPSVVRIVVEEFVGGTNERTHRNGPDHVWSFRVRRPCRLSPTP